MRRYVSGLGQASATSAEDLPDGLFLVRIERVQYRWQAQKPYYTVLFTVLEPKPLSGTRLNGRLYCTRKALWKLNWFLRDFGYDTELLGRDEIDERKLVGLCGVIQITHTVVNGTSLLNLDAFAPAGGWEELAGTASDQISASKAVS